MSWTDHFAAAVYSLDTALDASRISGGRGNMQAIRAIRPLLPYALMPLVDKPDHWIWVNRNYKPIGTMSKEWAVYEDYTYLHVRKDDKRIARLVGQAKAAHQTEFARGIAYLFDDCTSPFRDLRTARWYYALLRTVDDHSNRLRFDD